MLGQFTSAPVRRLRRLSELLLVAAVLAIGAQVDAAAQGDKGKPPDQAANALDTSGGSQENKDATQKVKNSIYAVDVRHTASPGCWISDLTSLKLDICSPTATRPLQQGDTLTVTVASADYDAAVKAHDANPVLFLNEVSLGKDATLSTTNTGADTRVLRFELASGTASQAIWSTMYREHGLLAETKMDVAVGWGDTVVFSKAADGKTPQTVTVSVTTVLALVAAVAFSALLLGLYLHCFFNTNVFRDSTPPEFWGKAQQLRLEILAELFPDLKQKGRRNQQIALAGKEAEVLEVVKVTYAEYVWDPNPPTPASIDVLVNAAMNGIVPGSDAEARTVVALAVCPKFVSPPKLTFSLARVQMGLWFLFGLGTCIFLWLVFSAFPAMGGSVVALITVSTVTAGASSLVDKNTPQFMGYSQGFFQDILTGPSDEGQPHRFQAVMVNALLLGAGYVYVCQHLGFPTFDGSWLTLLGVSGAAQVAGKQVLEKPKTTP